MQRLIQICSVSFVALYALAALLHDSFNPIQNFFCDLFNQGNFSSYLAIGALTSISILIASFFIWFANRTSWSKSKRRIAQIGGSLAAGFTLFIFTDYHDEFILIASLIGVIPVAMVSWEMIKNWSVYSPILGLLAFGLLGFYNLVFYLGYFQNAWPIIQKFAILLALIWVNKLVFSKQ